MDATAPINSLLDTWSQFPEKQGYALVGLDGYVDYIQRPVQLQTREGTQYYPSITEFGTKILAAANQSAQIEIHTQQVKPGGNAPIMALALASLGISNSCLGTFGYPDIVPLFRGIHPECQLISVGNPAQTNALEFGDGKLMLSEVRTFSELDWGTVKSRLALGMLQKQMDTTSLVALVDWSNLPHGNQLWQGVLADLVAPSKKGERHFFFDLADPSQKGAGEVQELLGILKGFAAYGAVTLGLNENEARKLVSLLGGPQHGNLAQGGRFLYKVLGVDRLVIHPLDRALAFDREGLHKVQGRVVRQPKVTTGGGDNFNAGLMLGLLQGLPLPECLVLAMAASGCYVASGKSPSREDLYAYLENWQQELKQGK